MGPGGAHGPPQLAASVSGGEAEGRAVSMCRAEVEGDALRHVPAPMGAAKGKKFQPL